MSHRQTLSSSFPKRGFQIKLLQPLPAWIAILGLILLTAVGVLAGAGSILRIAFPVGCFFVGMLLYLRYPVLYVGFTWWLYFITPWLRRVIDYRSGWDAKGVILVAPYLVTLIACITFLRYFPRSYRQGSLPLILAVLAVTYGSMIGLVKNPPVVTARAMLDWLSPIVFGFHLFMQWRNYPIYRQHFERVFTWCLLVTGVYGIVQYLVAPEWDRFWIIQTELVTNGTPEPLGIRVFSTMNSPLPFAVVAMAGLLLLFNSQGFLRIPATVAGYMAFLLSLVRASWLGWFVGLLTLFTSVKVRLQKRLIITILVVAVLVVPLATIEPFAEIISTRLETFADVRRGQDTSLVERSANYAKDINLALSNVIGNGVGSIYAVNDSGVLEQLVLDSGILDMFFTLGWIGAIPYLGGILLAILELFRDSSIRADAFASAARAIAVGILAQLALGSVMLGSSGMVFWGFLAMAMAARNYYKAQRVARIQRQ